MFVRGSSDLFPNLMSYFQQQKGLLIDWNILVLTTTERPLCHSAGIGEGL